MYISEEQTIVLRKILNFALLIFSVSLQYIKNVQDLKTIKINVDW